MNDDRPRPGADLAALVEFLPELESDDFSFGDWRGGDELPDGSIQMPWFEYSPRAIEFIRVAAADALLPGFAWPAWLDGPEGRELRDGPGRIERASTLELRRLLTAIIRGDRFNEGNVAAAFESGHLVRILRRAKVLVGVDA